ARGGLVDEAALRDALDAGVIAGAALDVVAEEPMRPDNPLLEARLSRYPPFLTLAEKPEFQAIGQDKSFTEARLRGAPLREILGNPNVAAIVKNPDQLRMLWGMIEPDLDDLVKFLHEGKSPKYSDPILGRWQFDVNAAIAAYRIAKTNITPTEMRMVKTVYTTGFSKLALVCFPDRQLVLKGFPDVKLPQQSGQLPTIETRNVQGKWKRTGEEYELSLTGLGTRKARLESGRLVFHGEAMPIVFLPED
ncbi:MAG: NAD(P)-dependent oxidoreductase, partial [Verrucomicrobiales bacterium]|nr:NAD(P)-dependent oxidoreductase [Verrucomicrobiales bacterium]